MSEQTSTILVLQGGGALGAYQAGVYEALAQAGETPDWIAGISIGAINAALIAGNAPENRVDRLHEFWNLVSSRLTAPAPSGEGLQREWFGKAAAWMVAATGAPGFFEPRLTPPFLAPTGTPGAISLYDTAPLRETLLRLVDFDRINSRAIRFSVGAVNVLTGNFIYFDNRERVIEPEHIMASGALPPGFPPVMIDGEPYWDGGLVSNTPLQYVLDHHPCTTAATIYQVDLFSARGAMPQTLDDVSLREKDIRFSSRTRLNTDMAKRTKRLQDAAMRLIAKLPPDLRDDPDARLLAEERDGTAISIMHLINRPEAFDTQCKDYEFSRASVDGHWAEGRHATELSLASPRWKQGKRHKTGIFTFDLADHQD
jgi:NTE family protein